jgi:hypothetical protein
MGTTQDHRSPQSQADRIQRCGRLVATVDGRRVDESLTSNDERQERRAVLLKGLADPVEIGVLRWE